MTTQPIKGSMKWGEHAPDPRITLTFTIALTDEEAGRFFRYASDSEIHPSVLIHDLVSNPDPVARYLQHLTSQMTTEEEAS